MAAVVVVGAVVDDDGTLDRIAAERLRTEHAVDCCSWSGIAIGAQARSPGDPTSTTMRRPLTAWATLIQEIPLRTRTS